ncbi:ATP-binding protein [Lysinibacillus sp. NPDC097287]|uniref:HAMP domain-containing sensor histidine kinase n=1 Tax=Lysinibacillus sp. NPDC097287 TaxID=3364144 RepID=UPI0037FF171E
MKLKTKIHLLTTLLMLVILVATNIGVYFLYEELAYDTEYKQLQHRGDELSTALSKLEVQTNIQQVIRAYMPTDGAVHVYDEGQNLKMKVQATLEMSDAKYITFEMPAIWPDGTVVEIELVQSMEEVARTMSLLKIILILVTLLAAIPILLASLALSRLILQPLERLSTTMKKSADTGKYEKIELTDKGKDELTEISRTFNGMMEKLELHYQKQQQFVSNASHELKTPITVIESYAKLLLRRGFDNEAVAKESLQAIANESARMHEMVLQLLELAKNKEQLDIQWEQIELASLLENTATQMQQAYHRPFIVDEAVPSHIYSDEKMLKQLLFILLDNARKYSEGEIRIHASENNQHVFVTIQDCGDGIPEEHLPHLFERFYRVGEDRNRKTGGTGLGLAIAKELANQLLIKIEVESVVGKGSNFTLCIPKEG